MSWDDNAYYYPEKMGLTTVGEISWSEPCYDFDLTIVWKDEMGTFYWASDSGCSCPAPFEDYTSIDTLESGSKWDAIKAIQDIHTDEHKFQENEYAAPQVADLIAKIVGAL